MSIRVANRSGSGGGALAVPNDLIFANNSARDTFFTNNPSRLTLNVDVIVNGVMQRYNGSVFQDMTTIVRGPQGDPATNIVQTVSGRTGNVVLTKADVGLGSVDNTSDLNKPVSDATQSALNNKADTGHTHATADITGLPATLSVLTTDVSNLQANKQDKLVSATNIKTVNGNSILGSGDILINTSVDASTSNKGVLQLAGDLSGTAALPRVTRLNGVLINTAGTAAGKLLKASDSGNASFETVIAEDIGAIPSSAKDVNNGVAGLDANGKLPSARLPDSIVKTVNGYTGDVVVTKAMLNLSNVDNTADADKELSIKAVAALNLKVDKSVLGENNGVATLDANGKIPSSQLGSISTNNTFVVGTQAARLAVVGAIKGDVAVQTDTNESFILQNTPASVAGNWVKLVFPATVTSVNGSVGSVTLTKSDISLGNVDNTSDLNKPVSTATQTELNKKLDNSTYSAKGVLVTATAANTPTALNAGTNGQVLSSDSADPTGLKWITLPTAATIVNSLTSTDTDKPLSAAQGKVLKDLVDAKPNLTGDIPLANSLTPTSGNSSTAARSDHVHPFTGVPVTAFNASGDLIVGSDAAAYTRVSLGTNGQFLAVDTSVPFSQMKWVTLADATPTAKGLMSDIDKTKLDSLANTSIINTLTSTSTVAALSANQGKVLQDSKANLASPTFTGTPAAPTAAADTNTTQLATTAFVIGQAGAAPSDLAATAAAGASLRYARENHVHRYPDGLHNGARRVGTFSGTNYSIESPTANKTRVAFNDTSISLNVENLARYSADASWTVIRGPAGTDALSHKIHMNNNETILHARNSRVRVAVFEGNTILRGPTATDAGSTYFNMEDTFLTAYCQGAFRFGADANNTWGHSPNEQYRYWLRNDAFVVHRTTTGDMLQVFNTTSGIRNSWGGITSDQRLKTPLRELSDEFLDSWGKHVKWGAYNWLEKDSNEADQRIQVGLLAQSVIAAFEEVSIDWKEWRVVEYFENEDRYGVCYDHCNAIENAYQRRRLDRLEALLAAK